VNQLELSPGVLTCRVIRRFIDRIAAIYPMAVSGYWQRRAKKNAKLREYTRDRLLKEVTA